MKFDCYRQLANKKILRMEDVSLSEAKLFLQTEKTALIVDEDFNKYTTLEELKNAESVRSETGAGYDNFFTRGSEIFEDSDRELFESDPDNPESSPECYNKWS